MPRLRNAYEGERPWRSMPEAKQVRATYLRALQQLVNYSTSINAPVGLLYCGDRQCTAKAAVQACIFFVVILCSDRA